MTNRWSPKPSIIGIDVGRASIKAVQVTPGDKGPGLDGAVCLSRGSGAAGTLDLSEARRLVRAMDRRKMGAARVVVVAPTDALVGGSITVPPADKDVPREKIVQSELARANQLTPGGFEFAWWDLPATSSGNRIGQAHALALPHHAVMNTLEALGELGLETVCTVPTSLALLAAAQRRPIDPRRIAAVLDLASSRAHLALLYAGRVVHERDLPDFNITRLRGELCEALRMEDPAARYALGHFGLRDEPDGVVACETTALLRSAAEPLAEEIGMSFAYVSHLYPEAELGPLLLAGGGANLPGLTINLASTLELETAAVSPGTLLSGECFGSEAADPALTAALGAALTGGAKHAEA